MTIVLIAIALYLAAATLLVVAVRRDAGPVRHWLLPALGAVMLHASSHVMAWRHTGSTDMHFFAALSLVGLGMAAFTTLVGALGRMAALGVMVFPLAALTLLGYTNVKTMVLGMREWNARGYPVVR